MEDRNNSIFLFPIIVLTTIILSCCFLLLARYFPKNERHLASIKVTIPEGYNVFDIGSALGPKLPNFDKNKFLLEAREGYLFPDTYFFFVTANQEDVIKSMTDNFNRKIENLGAKLPSESRTPKLSEIITIASLVEKEAKGDNDRGIIAGILWKRLAVGMPLEVDSAPQTYKVKGLPDSPICNPGLEAILAVLHPQKSVYLYYLHDKIGNIYYANTFALHQTNIKKYLK